MHRHRVRPSARTASTGAHVAEEALDSAPPQAFVPVRMPDPVRSTPAPVGATNGNLDESTIVRRKWDERPYQVSDTKRALHVEEHEPVWGAAADPSTWPKSDSAKPRAVLFETMSTVDKVPPLVDKLRDKGAAALTDIGLSVVLNGAWVPPFQYTEKGDKTGYATPLVAKPKANEPPKAPTGLEPLKRYLSDRRKSLVQNWQGPPLEITTAAWERRSRADDGGTMETVQSSVPYTSLRALAASNEGALAIGDALTANHETLWHKMGDDDMPIFDPNPRPATADDKLVEDYELSEPDSELTGLERIENSGEGTQVTTVVTFGYNLTTEFLPKTTTRVSAGITTALAALYRIEMELRNKIRDCGAPIYPSEPTSFYRTIRANTAADVWREVPDTRAGGGSGQQLEGAKLVLALTKGTGEFKNVSTSRSSKSEKSGLETKSDTKPRNASPQKVGDKSTEKSARGNSSKASADVKQRSPKAAMGITQFAYHTIQVDTSAGGRNDNLVKLLETWRAGADANAVQEQAVEAEINKLDQCALKHGEYLDKVFQKLPAPNEMSEKITDYIKGLVDSERTRAAQAVCAAIRLEIQNPVPVQGGQNAVPQNAAPQNAVPQNVGQQGPGQQGPLVQNAVQPPRGQAQRGAQGAGGSRAGVRGGGNKVNK